MSMVVDAPFIGSIRGRETLVAWPRRGIYGIKASREWLGS